MLFCIEQGIEMNPDILATSQTLRYERHCCFVPSWHCRDISEKNRHPRLPEGIQLRLPALQS